MQVQVVVDAFAQAQVLRGRVAELRAAISATAGTEAVESLIRKVTEADSTQLEIELHEANREKERLETDRNECNKRVGGLNQQIEQLAKNDDAAESMQRLQNSRSELADLSQQWLVQRTAIVIAERAMALFAEENEPELLRLSRRFLAELTGGRYTSIEHEAGGKFSVRASSGQAFAPDRLSSGTREQLYLALRMAYITHHSTDNEPLPVLMDDCFVNFDDQRLRHALTAISNWSDDIQTVVFSCHERTRDAICQIAPGTQVIDLVSAPEFVAS